VSWKKAGIMGLGLSGVAAAGFLARRGVQVVAADSKPKELLGDEALGLERLGVALRPGAVATSVFEGCEAVIASPGVPAGAGPLAGARAAGIPVLAEVELAARFVRGMIIGITGTNGKSTVTSLIGDILKASGLATRVCGNIGTPMTTVAEADLALPDEEALKVHYVVELSSFQLEGIRLLRPHIALLLNLSPDHQDRYTGTDEYYAAKARIFMNQRGDDVAIVNWDDAGCRQIVERLASRLFPFSLTQDLDDGAVLQGGHLVLRRGGRDEMVIEVSKVPIPGRHNLENVLASVSAAAHCGVASAQIGRAVSAFRGLPHRLELVTEVAGVSYYNDSKATNVGASARALEAFTSPIVLLLGGYDKGGDFESLRGALGTSSARAGRVRAVVTFGKAGDDIARRLEGSGPQIVRSGSLADAVKAASGVAHPGDVVLLAPACASFDAYTGYDKRGEDYRATVRTLVSQTGGPG
jgi:UDP-N-acetylmuramoylalanine--D-glutamate ligase